MGVGPYFGWECLEVHFFFLGEWYWVVWKRGLVIASHFFVIFKSESKSRMGKGRRRWSVAVWGRRWLWRGRHKGHFQIPCGIVVRGERRQPNAILHYICHRAAFDVRQMDSDILDNGYRPMGGKELVARGEGTGERVV